MPRCAASTWRPSITTAAPGEAEALYLLMKIAANGSTSRLYQKLVSEEKIASSAGGWYSGTGLDSGSIGLYAVAAEGVDLDKVEAGIERVLHELREKRRHARRAAPAPRRPSSPSSSTSSTARARSPGATPRASCSA